MFESLDEQIKRDTEMESTRLERLLKVVLALVVTVLVLGGLYVAVRMVE
ncbi:MAG: hypothetical protein ACM3S5_14120 [Rhodospirillales bacterium]